MNQFPEKSLPGLTGKSNFDQVSVEELEHITTTYPYYAIGHLLLARKLQHTRHQDYQASAQKAAIYIADISWLQYQLETSDLFITEEETVATHDDFVTSFSPAIEQSTPQPIGEITTAQHGHDDAKVVLTDGDDNVSTGELLQTSSTLPTPFEDINQHALAQNFSHSEEVESLPPAEEITEANAVKDEPADVAITHEFSLEEIERADASAHESLAEQEDEIVTLPENEVNDLHEAEPITTEFSLEEIAHSDALASATLSDVDETSTDEIFILPEAEPVSALVDTEAVEPAIEEKSDSDAGSEKAFDIYPAVEYEQAEKVEEALNAQPGKIENAIPAEAQVNKSSAANQNEAEQISQDEEEANDTGSYNEAEAQDEHTGAESFPVNFSNEEMLKNIKSALDTPLSPVDQDSNEALVPIDPYYTVDYFASQGIRLVIGNETGDKLERQLRSFTQWLKHMKKLGPEDALNDERSNSSEATVIRIADISNIQREVVTEAMAEVLEKQGKNEKAVQVYIKLSFLYPDKSAYFADKIKILKGIK